MPDSVIEANWDRVFIYDLVIVVTEQLDRVSSGSGGIGCFVCDSGV